jgi:hypothetical protein
MRCDGSESDSVSDAAARPGPGRPAGAAGSVPVPNLSRWHCQAVLTRRRIRRGGPSRTGSELGHPSPSQAGLGLHWHDVGTTAAPIRPLKAITESTVTPWHSYTRAAGPGRAVPA